MHIALPKVSICVSTYYPGALLEQVLKSIQSVNYPTGLIEVLVTSEPDDLLSQQIVERLNMAKSCRFNLLRFHSVSASATRNFGIRNCNAEVILAIDDDILIDKDILMESVKILSRENKVAAVVFGVLMESPSLDERLYHMKFLGSGLSSTNTVTPCSVFRRSVLAKVGYYREDMGPPLSIYEDWELGSRIVKKGFKVIVDGNLFATHLRKEALRHSMNTGKSYDYNGGGMLDLARRYIESARKNYWAFFGVMHSSPFLQKSEYAFYLLAPYIFVALVMISPLYAILYLVGIVGFVVVYSNIFRRQYRRFDLARRFVYPVIMILIRTVRTNLASWFFLRNKLHRKLAEGSTVKNC